MKSSLEAHTSYNSDAGSGMSLKEALDAAHGHEHNEDGSEMTAAQKAAREAEKTEMSGASKTSTPDWIIYYSVAITIIALVRYRSSSFRHAGTRYR